MRGVEIPEEFEGYSVLNYKDLFISAPDTAKTLMVKLIENLLDEVNPHFTMAGDVLLATSQPSTDDGRPQTVVDIERSAVVGPLSALHDGGHRSSVGGHFFAIHAGNGSMLGATVERGLVPLPIRAFDVVRVFRVRENDDRPTTADGRLTTDDGPPSVVDVHRSAVGGLPVEVE
jgi:hypothetical protein